MPFGVAATGLLAAPATDPIFDLIEQHLAVHNEFNEYLRLYGDDADDDAEADRLSAAEIALRYEVLTTSPKTAAGALAVLEHLISRSPKGHRNFVFDEQQADALCGSFIDFMRSLLGRGGA